MRSNSRATLLRPACLLMLALLAACERTPPPAAPTAAGPAPAPPASPADAAPSAPLVLSFAADDVRLGTEVGERTLAEGIVTTGKTGWLMFGPYIPLPAGKYQVALQGLVHEGHAGPVHVDVAKGKGTEVLAAADIDAPALLAPASPDGIVVLPFALAKDSSNLEVRVRVTDASKLSLSGFVIRAVP